ncbi:MAG: hypothetical protein RR614_08540 [Eubacterium sp.]
MDKDKKIKAENLLHFRKTFKSKTNVLQSKTIEIFKSDLMG